MAIPNDIQVLKDITFGKGGERTLLLDAFFPKNRPQAPLPVIVWIHGGAWLDHNLGKEHMPQKEIFELAGRGFFCVSIEYRLSDEAVFPAQLEDCKCAVRFLRAKASEYGIDPNRIGVWGESAGGYLAAFLGTAGETAEFEGNGGWSGCSSKVQAVCDWYGPTDLVKMADFPSIIDHKADNSAESLLIGAPVHKNKEKAEKANPINYITKDVPPFLIMHGDVDDIVPFNQSQLIHDKLIDTGCIAELITVKGQGHGFFKNPEEYEKVREFFIGTLK